MFEDEYYINVPPIQKQKIEQLNKKCIKVTKFDPEKSQKLFGAYHPQLQKSFVDIYNISRIWLEGMLFWKKIYPRSAFQQRNAYGKSVWVVKSQILKKYLNRFFNDIAKNIQNVNFIEIQLLKENNSLKLEIVQTLRLHLDVYQNFSKDPLFVANKKGINSVQLQIQIKRFLGMIEESHSRGFVKKQNEKASFKMLIGYFWNDNQHLHKSRQYLVQNWIKRQQKQQTMKQKKCLANLKSTNMSLEYFIMPKNQK